MIPARGWLVPIGAALVLIAMGVRARAMAVEPLDVPCSYVRTAVRIAGGIDQAIIEAIKRGYRADQIAAVIKKCRLK